jgi:ribonuclease D
MITDHESLAELASELRQLPAFGLDTEFLRERTYYAQLCLLQFGLPARETCVDTLAVSDLTPLRAALGDRACCKVLHAARQDLEVLWPAVGTVTGLFDTQVAAALIGLPAQVGYAELVRQLLGVSLSKGQTRTDWSRRPLSAAQLDYARDDVRYLLPLREALGTRLTTLGRTSWFLEEMAELDAGGSFTVEPEQAWLRLRGLTELDPHRQRLAQALAAWRERRAVRADRPRSWVLPDAALRELVTQAPRDLSGLERVDELPEGIRRNSGADLLGIIHAAGLPQRLPDLPPRRRPDPERVEVVRRLSELTQRAARALAIAPEILATRREMEQLAAGARDGAPLTGWRREVIGEQLLGAL